MRDMVNAEATEHHWREGWPPPSEKPEAGGAFAPPANARGNLEAAPPLARAQFSRMRNRTYKRAVRRAQFTHGVGLFVYRGAT